VFADKGPDTPVIDDFIKAAGVARGTFYNYYRSTEELLEATSKWLEDDLLLSIETVISGMEDPVERVATGVQLWLGKAASDLAWCAFTVRVRQHGQLVERQVANDIRAGIECGDFKLPNVEIGRDLVIGTVREAMVRITNGQVPRAYAHNLTRVVLQGLGLNQERIGGYLIAPVPKMKRVARTLKPPAAGS
jgi:AcrR family transcriptional regulator